MAEALKHVALDGLHRELGARMGGFAGYDMPIQYSGLKAEHLATRASCGLFDVSHMGQLLVRPRDGRIETLHAQLEACLPLDFSDWPEGAQRYSLLLNERGGIEDDLMLVNLGSEVRIIVNAGNRDHDFHLLTTRCPELEFTWIDAALIALQGPQAEAVLAALDPRARSPRFMESVSLELLGVPCFATRSGYTGEDGYEISIPTAEAEPLVRHLLADPCVTPVWGRATPCGWKPACRCTAATSAPTPPRWRQCWALPSPRAAGSMARGSRAFRAPKWCWASWNTGHHAG